MDLGTRNKCPSLKTRWTRIKLKVMSSIFKSHLLLLQTVFWPVVADLLHKSGTLWVSLSLALYHNSSHPYPQVSLTPPPPHPRPPISAVCVWASAPVLFTGIVCVRSYVCVCVGGGGGVCAHTCAPDLVCMCFCHALYEIVNFRMFCTLVYHWFVSLYCIWFVSLPFAHCMFFFKL